MAWELWNSILSKTKPTSLIVLKMKKIYLDNAATTPLRKEVIQTMIEILEQDYGNPSSTHSFGRSAKTYIESARKAIAHYLNCSSQEIIFTSSATEATNWILSELVKTHSVKRILTSMIEHHATLYTCQKLAADFGIELVYIPVLKNGNLDLTFLESALQKPVKTVVSLMHVNNEIGTQLNLELVSQLCKTNQAIFHCDTVQTMGKISIDFQKTPLDFAVASAHKFHGPKGIGFAYINKNISLQPLLVGGEQEKGLRAGTEATHQIAGMAKAFELANIELDIHRKYVSDLKEYCTNKLKINFEGILVNGTETFYNILNVSLPFSEDKTAMLLFNLDLKGIAVSRGSACQSGSPKPSHVLAAFLSEEELKKPSLRISFSHFNTKEDIDGFIEALKSV